MKKETLITVEYIPYKGNREKQSILNKYKGRSKIKIDSGYVYIERKRRVS